MWALLLQLSSDHHLIFFSFHSAYPYLIVAGIRVKFFLSPLLDDAHIGDLWNNNLCFSCQISQIYGLPGAEGRNFLFAALCLEEPVFGRWARIVRVHVLILLCDLCHSVLDPLHDDLGLEVLGAF